MRRARGGGTHTGPIIQVERLFLFPTCTQLNEGCLEPALSPLLLPCVHLRVHFSTLLNTSYAPLSINSDLARPIFSGSTGRFLRIYMRRYHACNRPTNAFRFFPPRFSVGMIFPRDRNRTRKSDASRSRDNETEDFVWDLYSRWVKSFPLLGTREETYLRPWISLVKGTRDASMITRFFIDLT